MGCSPSRSGTGGGGSGRGRDGRHQGNLLVEGFMRYCTSSSGWTKVKTAIKHIHIEEYAADEPLGTWRGVIVLEGVDLGEVVPYVQDRLGIDEFELLQDDEDGNVYRDVFDFQKFAEVGKMLPLITGDHRGETAERMEERHSTLQLSKLGVRGRKSAMNQQQGKSTRTLQAVPETAGGEDPAAADDDGGGGEDDANGGAGGGESKSDDGDDEPPPGSFKLGKNTLSDGGATDDEPPTPMLSLKDSQSTNSNNTSWTKMLFGRGSSRNLNTGGPGGSQDDERYPKRRELVFRRQDFALDAGKHVVICESTRYKSKGKGALGGDGYVRGELHMMGVLLEGLGPEKKVKERVKVTFVLSVDPCLDKTELAKVSEEALSAFGGKTRVVAFLLQLRDFFMSDTSRLIQKFRTIASASSGEFGWQDIERSKNELQLGTNVQHPKLGHGIVQSFDMKGRVKIVYDNGEVVEHTPEEKDDLRVTVMIGTRVSHPERGMGTVKQFDEMGRVHVRFDNGEYHRYKQAAWKKKMHTYKLMGIGGALGTVKLSWRPFEESKVREGQGRVKFAVGVTTAEVLEFILDYKEDAKSGNIIERRIVEKISDFERIIYEHRKMPEPISPRDFVLREVWREVAPNTYVVVVESVKRADIPERPGIVRGEIILSGYLLEPLYLSEEAYDGEDHVARITYQLCVDIKGFIHPNAVAAVRQAQLLGILTDVRQNFWGQSEKKAKSKVMDSRKSKRMSILGGGSSSQDTSTSAGTSNRTSVRLFGSSKA